MTLNSWSYGLLLAVALFASWLVPGWAGTWVLLALSIVFYAWGTPSDLLVLAPLLLAVHAIARRVQPGQPHARRWLGFGVTLLVGSLVYYKYLGLLAEGVVGGAHLLGFDLPLAAPRLQAPLGISFFVFLLIHYLVEVGRGSVQPVGLRDESLFVLFFPTVVSGPLKRIEAFEPQLRAPGRPIPDDLHEGLSRIVIGLAKKMVVADQLAPLCARVFAKPDRYEWVELWLASYGYALQIYFDFSGYSDIAIGSARLLGFRVPENFDYPYFRTNIAQFWRHWHMTLTGWILQYVYIPLGGNRRGEIRSNWNRFAAMALCGLWHGSAFHFAVWGMYHGVLLNLYHAYTRLRARLRPSQPQGSAHPAVRFASGLLTFHAVVVGWVLFAVDLDEALPILGRMLLLT
ncbi:MAG: MBOAT family protein [Deltaproteobacteria bacterium]|nr:MBOAT family protein [Deltaproteobacteria bacterium]